MFRFLVLFIAPIVFVTGALMSNRSIIRWLEQSHSDSSTF
jgi:hypothetical protein